MLGVPLLREGSCVGVMAMTRATPRPFTTKQIELVTTFADQAVIAIENVRLFDEVQARTRELQESLEYQTAISDVLNVISARLRRSNLCSTRSPGQRSASVNPSRPIFSGSKAAGITSPPPRTLRQNR